jgi:hypothetical protein
MKTQLAFVFLALAACHDHSIHAVPHVQHPRPVSIEVEVYDPITNGVWEDVSVRIVESWQEWSGCVCVSPYEDWYLTDFNGRVFLDEVDLAWADVGFLEDGYGAVLHPRFDEDEAVVTLELDAVGFAPVFVDVTLRWDQPDVFIEVPFY